VKLSAHRSILLPWAERGRSRTPWAAVAAGRRQSAVSGI